ncbi:hypothetical protein ACXR0O_19620 [Verrucomicrobiota bacterium sgz303538]
MKNPLQLFRSRSEVEAPLHPSPFLPLQRRGPPTTVVAASLTVLFLSFGGLAAGLKWLQTDQPRDNRPWELNETPLAATPVSVSDKEMLEAPNPDALPPLDSPVPADAPSPQPTGAPPPASQPAPPIAERLAETPPRAPEPAKKSTTSKAIKSPRVKTSSSKVASVTKATPSKKRTVAQAAKPLRSQSLDGSREKKSPEFAQSDQTTTEQQFSENEPPYYPDRGNSFPQGPVLRPFFEENERYHYDRAPRRELTRVEPRQFVEIRRPNVVVRYRVNYAGSSSGNRILVRRVNPTYRVIPSPEREDW